MSSMRDLLEKMDDNYPFAGEKAKPEQIPGDQVRGKEKFDMISPILGKKPKQHPAHGRLVGGAAEEYEESVDQIAEQLRKELAEYGAPGSGISSGTDMDRTQVRQMRQEKTAQEQQADAQEDDVEKQKVQKSKNDTTKKTIDYSEDENKYLTFNFPDGRKYVGQSKNGKAHGQGTFSWANGNECSGEWKNDFIHRGTCFIDGDKYTGEFKNNEAIGKGKYVSKNGSIYEGDFEKDKFHGKGVFTYPDGKKYIGEFKEGVLHGFGLVIFLNGEVYNVKHENDKLISHSLVTGLVASPNGYLSTENSNLYSNRETILFYDNATKSMRECAGDVIAGTCTNYAPYKTSSYNNDSLFYNPATGAMQKCLSQVFGKCHNFAPQTFTRSIDQLYYNPRTKSMSTCLNANRQGKCLAFGISPSINRSALKNEYRGFQSQSKTNPYYFQVPETASDLIEQGLNMLGGGCTLGLNC